MTIRGAQMLMKEWLAVSRNDHVNQATRKLAEKEAEKYGKMRDALQRKQDLGEIAKEIL